MTLPVGGSEALRAFCADAGHDANGNPRRCFVVLSRQGAVAAVDEGYMGPAALRVAGFPELEGDWLFQVKVPAGEYRRLLRDLPNNRMGAVARSLLGRDEVAS